MLVFAPSDIGKFTIQLLDFIVLQKLDLSGIQKIIALSTVPNVDRISHFISSILFTTEQAEQRQ
jgi:hypothetical protein